MAATSLERCDCGGLVPVEDGPTNAYMRAAPACWRMYGELGAILEGAAAWLHVEMMRTHPDVFYPLEAPDLTGALTHRHVSAAPRDEWGRRAEEWAHSVWLAWTPHHAQIRAWNVALVPDRVS